MMADHELLCLARNELADALKVLLKADIMTIADFRRSLKHTLTAANSLTDLCIPEERKPEAPQIS